MGRIWLYGQSMLSSHKRLWVYRSLDYKLYLVWRPLSSEELYVFIFLPSHPEILTALLRTDANLDLQVGLHKQICSITSIPTTWKWSYTSASSDLVADVSYDLWLSTSSTGTGASSTSSYEM